jgi:hypothetical protein
LKSELPEIQKDAWHFSCHFGYTVFPMADGLKETDLFPPLADFLQREGYSVHAEVLGTDIAARRDEELLLVEIKLRFNIDVLLQAAGRQGAADKTYIAVPCRNGKRLPKWSELKDVLRRLGLGLFLVHFTPPLKPQVQEVLAAEDARAIKNLRKKRKAHAGLLREMEGRPANFNTGGSVKKKLVTAYLVDSLRVALLLRKNKPPESLSPKKLRKMGAPHNCGAILYNNYHGWFSHPEPGGYTLSAAGKKALRQYRDVIKSLTAASKLNRAAPGN